MKLKKTTSIAFAALLIAACSPSKKSISSPAPAPAAATAPATPSPAPAAGPKPAGPSFVDKTKFGVYAPGSDELTAIQMRYKETTMETLSQGYTLYTGACTNCHGAKSIYSRPEEAWPAIIDNMSARTNLTAAEKNAVLKYVLAVKATQASKGK